MLHYSTEFPIKPTHSPEDFVTVFKGWILGSPYSRFNESHLSEIETKITFKDSAAGDKIHLLRDTNNGRESVALRYIKLDDGLEWTTDLVFSKMQTDTWVSIRTSCQADRPITELPSPKKPIIIQQILEKLGGGMDGPLSVQNTPHYLKDTEIGLASDLINGCAGCHLPIIYVSTPFDGERSNWDSKTIAKKLSGMAHVVVEPNRIFSNRLKIDVNSRNVYGGALGIYWPNSDTVRRIFQGNSARTQEDLIEEVRRALTNRLPLERCAWFSVQEESSRKALKQLKEDGSEELNKYCEYFDEERNALNIKNERAHSEIERLKSEIRALEARTNQSTGVTLKIGNEQDLYPDEITQILLDAINDAISRVHKDSRREHVMQQILDSNKTDNKNAKYRNWLKTKLTGYTSMNSRLRQDLIEKRFEVTEDGKHYKLRFANDDRYTYTLAKSGSDSRGGLNAASDIGRLLF